MQFLAGDDWAWIYGIGRAMAEFFAKPGNWASLAQSSVPIVISVVSFIFLSHQRKLQIQATRAQLIAPVAAWGERAIRTLAQCRRFVLAGANGPGTDTGEFIRQRDSLLASLSTEVDLGRLYFPNIPSRNFGKEKEFAFRGYRPPILDSMMFSYNVLEEIRPGTMPSPGDHAGAAAIFDKARRIVISELRRYTSDEIALSGGRRLRRQRNPGDDGHIQVGKLAELVETIFPDLLVEKNYVSWADGEARHDFLPHWARALRELRSVASPDQRKQGKS